MSRRRKLKQRKQVLYLLIAILLWLLLISFLSTQNGLQTANTSEGMAMTIARMLYRTPNTAQINEIHMAIRRYAHVGLFFVLGIMIGLMCVKGKTAKRVWLRFVGGYGFLLFCSFFDEWHKQFISGRHNQMEDALLNVRGCTIGLGIIALIYIIRRFKNPSSL